MEIMITVETALALIKEHTGSLPVVLMPVQNCNGLVLAEDVFASIDIPAFPQSAMDGYAYAFEEGCKKYKLVGERAAGNNGFLILEKGTAIRIFTGAAVPEGADTVLMQEKAVVENGILEVKDEQLKKGGNVRPVGTEIKKDVKALGKGTVLQPGSVGFLAGAGIGFVKVYPKPKIVIIVTGNELQSPGENLNYGQVYESNSSTLISALDQHHINNVTIFKSNDDLDQLRFLLEQALNEADMVLITGGVSVGDYDFTLSAFEKCQVQTIFHKIKQKPGKPLLYGMKEGKVVFGLPGNPASVLTCFYEYIIPAIGLMTNCKKDLTCLKIPIAHDYKKPSGLTHFLKAVYNGSTVNIQTGQESYKLSSYATANCLAVLPEALSEIKAGAIIDVHLLPS